MKIIQRAPIGANFQTLCATLFCVLNVMSKVKERAWREGQFREIKILNKSKYQSNMPNKCPPKMPCAKHRVEQWACRFREIKLPNFSKIKERAWSECNSVKSKYWANQNANWTCPTNTLQKCRVRNIESNSELSGWYKNEVTLPFIFGNFGWPQIDWCCFYYFVRNSLVALLEALCAWKQRRRYHQGSVTDFLDPGHVFDDSVDDNAGWGARDDTITGHCVKIHAFCTMW